MPADSKTTSGRIGCHGHAGLWQGQARRQADPRPPGSRHLDDIAKDPKAAAAFLEYLQSPERLKALHEKTGWIPTNSNFDTSVINDPVVRRMWKPGDDGENIPYLPMWCPGQFYEQALLPTAQQVVAGQDHRRGGGRAGGQGRQGMARLRSGHGRQLQEVGERSLRLTGDESGHGERQGLLFSTRVTGRRIGKCDRHDRSG